MASPGPSRCGSNNPLCPSEMEDGGGGSGPHTRRQIPLMRTSSSPDGGATSSNNSESGRPRGRSDSETLSDDCVLLESNDEGIGTDHIDEKIEEGQIRSAKDLQTMLHQKLHMTLNQEASLLDTPVYDNVHPGFIVPSIIIHNEDSVNADDEDNSKLYIYIQYFH